MTTARGAAERGPIHLDTNFVVGVLIPGSAAERSLVMWLDAERPVAVSAAAWAEFLCGPLSPGAVRVAFGIVGSPLPLGEREAVLAADCYNAGGRRRGSMVDCMIAATAITAGAALATANVDDFRRLTALGLRLAD